MNIVFSVEYIFTAVGKKIPIVNCGVHCRSGLRHGDDNDGRGQSENTERYTKITSARLSGFGARYFMGICWIPYFVPWYPTPRNIELHPWFIYIQLSQVFGLSVMSSEECLSVHVLARD